MTSSFPLMIDRVLTSEGGFSNNPSDPGNWTGGHVNAGLLKGTKFGLAANTYPHLDIENLSRPAAVAIYKRDWWDRLHCDQLDDGVAFQLLDAAVNSGIPQATRFLQRAVGVADDGVWGEVSRAALAKMFETDVILLFLAERIEFMAKLKTFDTFGRGWMRRIAQNLRYGAEDA